MSKSTAKPKHVSSLYVPPVTTTVSSPGETRVGKKNIKPQLTQAQKLTKNVKILSALDKIDIVTTDIFKSVIVLLLFVFINYVAETLGSKTRIILSNKYWYNKQIVIFLTIYLVINITSLHGLHLAPIYTLLVSIVGWFLFNFLTSLGQVWLIRNPPITWFGIIIIPLILFYVTSDFKTYYAELPPNEENTKLTNIFNYVQKFFLIIAIILMIYGFTFAYIKAKRKLKSKFSFKDFFFSIKPHK